MDDDDFMTKMTNIEDTSVSPGHGGHCPLQVGHDPRHQRHLVTLTDIIKGEAVALGKES